MSDKSQESRVESRRPVRPRLAPRALTSDLRPLTSSPRGVTLIELLIAIMIISILAAAVLGVAAVAGETAREAKTRAIVGRLHTLLMEQYDTYVNRRIKLRQKVLDGITAAPAPPGVPQTAFRGQLKAEARLHALRELMLMEVPDRWSDVVLNEVTGLGVPTLYPIYLDVTDTTTGRTELASLYLRTFRRIAAGQNKIRGAANTLDDVLANQGAECLYMFVMNACGDGEARTLIPESSIGDTDGDGAFEFLDGWGHPIEFIRWAPGFESDIQVNANDFGFVSNPTSDPEWVSAAGGDHDPYDLYRVDLPSFRLLPLIFSAGRDEEYGLIARDRSNATWIGVTLAALSNNVTYSALPKLFPWRFYSDGGNDFYVGTADANKTNIDNIDNHLIRTR